MFDLTNYMTAVERIELFRADNPEMKYDTEHGHYTDNKGETWVWVKAKLYTFFDDPTPRFTGLAEENIKTQFALEKAESSAYARAVTNSGDPKYSTTKDGKKAPRANREEMEKVARVENDAVTVKIDADLSNDWEGFLAAEPKITTLAEGVELVAQTLAATVRPECKHGAMMYKEGTSAKGPYSGYVCIGKRGDQCPAKWNKN
jgi:hypothetical protein